MFMMFNRNLYLYYVYNFFKRSKFSAPTTFPNSFTEPVQLKYLGAAFFS